MTPANGHVVLHGAVGALAARDGAGVDTVVVLAGALRPAVGVLVTLSLCRKVKSSSDLAGARTDRTLSTALLQGRLFNRSR